mmetsp:Transcript_5960/g.12375  ORF Transcript_5960/g.12375 Transcript_5960/m.12375 type:complete len:160 (-) Transcript_5960:73-552(-)
MGFFHLLIFFTSVTGSNALISSSRGARGVASSPLPHSAISLTCATSTTALSATKKKKAAKKIAPENFKKAELVSALAERTGLTKKDSESILQTTLEIIMEEVGSGKKITLPGFGSFTLKDRAERKGRNPQTGEELLIPASKSPSFTVSKTWKDEVNGRK